MKLFSALIILFFFVSCSFDNKSGIWNNNSTLDENDILFKDFKDISHKNTGSFRTLLNFDDKESKKKKKKMKKLKQLENEILQVENSEKNL